MSFEPEYPGAIVIPAHESNYGYSTYTAAYRAFTVHTPEEPADDWETTPNWFQDPAANASTIFYLDNDGDVIQMVPFKKMAWAQGAKVADRRWKDKLGILPPWSTTRNLNAHSISCEVEGYAATIHRTMPIGGIQWKELIKLIKWCSVPRAELNIEGYPLTREFVHGHDEINTKKRDPGSRFAWDALMRDLNSGEPGIEISINASLVIIEEQVAIMQRLVG
jgi:N-acetyl-anhydromuramyl-L-alanine amidase AmpD